MTGKPTEEERAQKGQLVATWAEVVIWHFPATTRPWGVVQSGRLYPWRYKTWAEARRATLRWFEREGRRWRSLAVDDERASDRL